MVEAGEYTGKPCSTFPDVHDLALAEDHRIGDQCHPMGQMAWEGHYFFTLL